MNRPSRPDLTQQFTAVVSCDVVAGKVVPGSSVRCDFGDVESSQSFIVRTVC